MCSFVFVVVGEEEENGWVMAEQAEWTQSFLLSSCFDLPR